jgi:large subunit ribosomal protein L24
MVKYKIKRDDVVVVTAGKHKGRTGRVLQVLTEKGRVVVEKINLVKRQVKPQGDRPGGTVEKEASLHISNVAHFDATTGAAFRTGRKILEDGRKVRFNKKSGAAID